MSKTIALYNHKGGVSKTTTTFNLCHFLAEKGNKILVIDADPQCNMTEIFLASLISDLDEESEKTGSIQELPGTSILDILKPRINGEEAQIDIDKIEAIKISDNISIIRGDVSLSEAEDSLAEAHIQRFSSKIHEKRNYVAIHDFINRYSEKNGFDYVFIDVGPSSGALTRSCILACDAFFIPLNPDRFSIQALSTLSVILTRWFKEHSQIIDDFKELGLPVKEQLPRLLGTIPQFFKKYKGKPKKGYKLWMERVPTTLFEKIIPKLSTIDSSSVIGLTLENCVVTNIPDFGSLAPCSQECGKAVFNIDQNDTALINNGTPWTGATWTDAKKRISSYKECFHKLEERIKWI